MVYVGHYDSPLGGITMASDGGALVGLWFDGQEWFRSTVGDSEECVEVPLDGVVELGCDGDSGAMAVLDAARRWLEEYFAGRDPGFVPAVRMIGTEFQMRVWDELMGIPYGGLRTYGEIARAVGCRSAQAVGGAVGRNPISLIVPCHRVVGADGSLTGYAGGLYRKRYLLELEGSVDGAIL